MSKPPTDEGHPGYDENGESLDREPPLSEVSPSDIICIHGGRALMFALLDGACAPEDQQMPDLDFKTLAMLMKRAAEWLSDDYRYALIDALDDFLTPPKPKARPRLLVISSENGELHTKKPRPT